MVSKIFSDEISSPKDSQARAQAQAQGFSQKSKNADHKIVSRNRSIIRPTFSTKSESQYDALPSRDQLSVPFILDRRFQPNGSCLLQIL